MIFKTFQLIIDDDNPVKSDLEKIYKYTDTSLNKSIFYRKKQNLYDRKRLYRR